MVIFKEVAGKSNLQFKNVVTGQIARQNRKTKIWTDNLVSFAVPCLVCGHQIYITEQNSQDWFLHTTYTKARRLAVSNYETLQNQVETPFLKTSPILTQNFMPTIPQPPIIKKTLTVPGILQDFDCLCDTVTGELLDSEKKRVLAEISKLSKPYEITYEREADLFNLELIATLIDDGMWSSAIGKNVSTFEEAVYVALSLSWQWAEEDTLADQNEVAPVLCEAPVAEDSVEVKPRVTDRKEQKATIRDERLAIALENKNRLEEKRLKRMDKDSFAVVKNKVSEFLKEYSSIEINGVAYSETEIKLALKIIKEVIND